MVSVRTIGVAVLGSVTLALPAGVAASSPAAATSDDAAAQPPAFSLTEPENLPVGGPPHAAYITGLRGGPIYRTGKPSLPTGPGGNQKYLMRARGGYVLTVSNSKVRFVSDTGARHQVFGVRGSTSEYVHDTVASRDGRYVAITLRSNADRHYDHVVVRRISHPRTIIRHNFSIPVVVASLTDRRALLTPDGLVRGRRGPDMPTRWWNLNTGHLRLFDNAGRPGLSSEFGGQSAADLTAGQVALMRGDHNHIVSIPRRPHHAWNTGAHEWVLSWSPDDRYVITASWTPEEPRVGNGWDTYAIRRARDGKLITLFTAYESLLGNRWTPIWENATTFVADAEHICDHGSCADITNVRCTVHGPCDQVELVGLPVGFDSVGERRLPSS